MDAESTEHVVWLRREFALWEAEGLISADHASRILARYSGQEVLVAQTQAQRRIVVVFGMLGAVLIGLGVILFFAANWRRIPVWPKFWLILAATVGIYILGFWLRFSRGYPGIGNAVLLLGGLLYGAGIFLVGQMFHVQAEPHYGLLPWALGVLPLGYLLPLNAMVGLGATLLAAWVAIIGIEGPARYGVHDLRGLQMILASGILLYAVGRLHAQSPRMRVFGRPYLMIGALVTFVLLFWYALLATHAGEDLVGPLLLPSGLGVLQVVLTGCAVVGAGLAAAVDSDRVRFWEAGLLAVLTIAPWALTPGLAGVLWSNAVVFTTCVLTAVLAVHRRDVPGDLDSVYRRRRVVARRWLAARAYPT